jgi:hypothetical protein
MFFEIKAGIEIPAVGSEQTPLSPIMNHHEKRFIVFEN